MDSSCNGRSWIGAQNVRLSNVLGTCAHEKLEANDI